MPELLPNWDSHDVEALRRFAQVRLVIVDLDGTLISSPVINSQQLTKTVQELSRSLCRRSLTKEQRVYLTIATGRTFSGVKPALEKLELPKDIPLILYNGSVVLSNDSFQVLYQRRIANEGLLRVLEVCDPYNVSVLAYFYDAVSPSPHSEHGHEYVIGWGTWNSMKYEFNGLMIDWQNGHFSGDTMTPSAILVDTSYALENVSIIETNLSQIEGVSVTRSGSRYIEIRPGGSDKGVALECATSYLQLHRNNILALGDNDIDVEMLAWAGIGVSIEGASPAAIQSSDYVCRHGTFEGVIEVLRLVKNAKRYYARSLGIEENNRESHRTMV